METLKGCVVAVVLSLAACQSSGDDSGEHYSATVEALGACVVPVNLTALDLYADGEAVITATIGRGAGVPATVAEAALTWHRIGNTLWLSPATLELGQWYTSSVMAEDGKPAEVAIADLHGYSCMYRVKFAR